MITKSTLTEISISRRTFLVLGGAVVASPLLGPANAAESIDDWPSVLANAKGKTAYWHAWGGDPRINDYIAWTANTVKERFGIDLKHVKVVDTGSVVQTVIAEKASGTSRPGSVDLIWINGENFVSMKEHGLLLSRGWTNQLPNFGLVDVKGKPTTVIDFTVPTDGLESPWGMAQLTFFADSKTVASPPRSLVELVAWTKAHPGRFTYPMPPDFIGSTYLKQMLLDVAPDTSLLSRPVDDDNFGAQAGPVFELLDEMHPHLWRQARAFPQNSTALRQLLADGEIDIAFAFNPAAASNAIAAGELPDTVRSFVFTSGMIGNTHFVTIPYNSAVAAAGMVVADFLISPEAQARKQDPNIWGDPTVLSMAALPLADAELFNKLELGVATLRPEDLGKTLPEPNASWTLRLETEWQSRYSS
ncbi:MAG: ABC transporter substrate-binding protein [Mesorhizobium sp.]